MKNSILIGSVLVHPAKDLLLRKNLLLVNVLGFQKVGLNYANHLLWWHAYSRYFKVDPRKIGNLVHEIILLLPDLTTRPLKNPKSLSTDYSLRSKEIKLYAKIKREIPLTPYNLPIIIFAVFYSMLFWNTLLNNTTIGRLE